MTFSELEIYGCWECQGKLQADYTLKILVLLGARPCAVVCPEWSFSTGMIPLKRMAGGT